MSIKDQLINDIKLLPESTVEAISIIVKELIERSSEVQGFSRPVFGSGKGKMWIADDFDEPLEELREYEFS